MFGGTHLFDIITIFEDILSGKRKQFPLETWNQQDSKATFIKLVRYVVFDKLHWNRKQFVINFV